MLRAAGELAPLGVERTDFRGTFYAPLAFPGLVGEPFDRLRNGVHEPAVVKDSIDAFELLLSGGVGGIPFAAFAGGADGGARYGTWQRLSYGSKDVKELAVFMDRVKARIEHQGRLGAGAALPAAPRTRPDAVWDSTCTLKYAKKFGILKLLGLPSPFEVVQDAIADQVSHYAGIAADPPDPDFQRLDLIEATVPIVPVAGLSSLPSVDAPSPPSRTTDTTSFAARILVAEDNDAGFAVLEAYLRRAGYTVQRACHGREAIAAAPRCDLILMDLEMPEVDGPESTQRIRASEREAGSRTVPILALTAHDLRSVGNGFR